MNFFSFLLTTLIFTFFFKFNFQSYNLNSTFWDINETTARVMRTCGETLTSTSTAPYEDAVEQLLDETTMVSSIQKNKKIKKDFSNRIVHQIIVVVIVRIDFFQSISLSYKSYLQNKSKRVLYKPKLHFQIQTVLLTFSPQTYLFFFNTM